MRFSLRRRGTSPPAAHIPATDLFTAVLRDRWAPALRELGLTGSGRRFVLPDERDWALLGFQSSRATTAAQVRFTVNLQVVGKQAWEEARETSPHLSARPSPNTVGPHRYYQRLGSLTHDRDHWWRLLAGDLDQPVVHEVLVALRDVAVPALRSELADQSPGPRGFFEGRTRA